MTTLEREAFCDRSRRSGSILCYLGRGRFSSSLMVRRDPLWLVNEAVGVWVCIRDVSRVLEVAASLSLSLDKKRFSRKFGPKLTRSARC